MNIALVYCGGQIGELCIMALYWKYHNRNPNNILRFRMMMKERWKRDRERKKPPTSIFHNSCLFRVHFARRKMLLHFTWKSFFLSLGMNLLKINTIHGACFRFVFFCYCFFVVVVQLMRIWLNGVWYHNISNDMIEL